ncbi:hypothetical protein GFS31_32680 [Leptolyngbya sp. BL0902]|nr:hypothetical protein GFS31_32680 [Leptolyngbya sp. BL0902]
MALTSQGYEHETRVVIAGAGNRVLELSGCCIATQRGRQLGHFTAG